VLYHKKKSAHSHAKMDPNMTVLPTATNHAAPPSIYRWSVTC
jgi:hypothetical protein